MSRTRYVLGLRRYPRGGLAEVFKWPSVPGSTARGSVVTQFPSHRATGRPSTRSWRPRPAKSGPSNAQGSYSLSGPPTALRRRSRGRNCTASSSDTDSLTSSIACRIDETASGQASTTPSTIVANCPAEDAGQSSITDSHRQESRRNSSVVFGGDSPSAEPAGAAAVRRTPAAKRICALIRSETCRFPRRAAILLAQ